MMNCKKAEQLIPLFIEADLDAAEMQQVSHHLETCAACRATVAEFEASQSLLRSVAMPAFDEAMFVEVRSAVMKRIAQPATRPAFAAWWQPIWNWKFAFAAAVILLVVGVAIRQRGGKSIDNPVASGANVSKSDLAVVRKSPDIKTPPAAQPFQPRMGRKHQAQGGVRGSERHPENSAIKQLSPERATIVDGQIASAVIAPSVTSEAVSIFPRVDTLGFTLPPPPPAENAILPPDKNTNEPEMLRMEFQTADPNIRILWLTPKEPARTTPAEDSK
ncbi:MAG: zf-HC2 domain-containing protein [Blastocatellia bacterium]|nr:zf-HC2 domain-containing protein [Blastocatellia bacterium]